MARSSISEANAQVKKFRSLCKIASELGYYLTDDYPDHAYEFVIVPDKHDQDVETFLEVSDRSGWHKLFPLIYCKDLDEVIVAISALAMTKNKCLDLNGDTWKLRSFDKVTKADLKEINSDD